MANAPTQSVRQQNAPTTRASGIQAQQFRSAYAQSRRAQLAHDEERLTIPLDRPSQRKATQQTTIQTNQLQARFKRSAPQQEDLDEHLLEEEREEQEQVSIQEILQRARMQDMREEEEEQIKTAVSSHTQDAAHKAIKQNIPRGAAYLGNGIANALDLGTGGTSLIIDVFIYLITLGYFNVQMIYGSWIAKGESNIIPPLKWDPIPMPIDKDGIILQGLVIMADIVVVIALIVLMTLQVLILLLLFAPQLMIAYFGANALSSFF